MPGKLPSERLHGTNNLVKSLHGVTPHRPAKSERYLANTMPAGDSMVLGPILHQVTGEPLLTRRVTLYV